MNELDFKDKNPSPEGTIKKTMFNLINIPYIYILLKSKLNFKEIYGNLRAYSLIKHAKLFDEKYYLEKTPTLKNNPMNPIIHYLYHGYKENKNPSKKFNTEYYTIKYGQIKKSGMNPLVHYLLYGKKEGKYPRKKEENESPEKLLKQIKEQNKKIKKLQNQIEKSEQDEIQHINKEQISHEIEIFKDCGITKEKRTHELIISLTTSSKKIYKLHYTIYSLLKQTMKADRIILWLAREEFPNFEEDLPKNLKNLKKQGLSIEWCENIKDYKKLIPTLKKYPNDIIITANDNIFYPESWLEQLYNEYDEKNIIAHRIKEIKTNEYGKLTPSSWKLKTCVKEEDISIMSFPDGDGGVLYPPNSLSSDIFNQSIFAEIDSSDLWFWAMAIINNRKIKAVPNGYSELNYVDLPEKCVNNEEKLENKNNHNTNTENIDNEDDSSIKTLLNHYPEILEKIKKIIAPKISVIIPVYNSEKYIEQCLFSVLNQTLNEIEVICVNNGSDDNSLNILKKFSDKDKRMDIINQEKQKMSIACNNGIKHANGEYTIFLNSNDWLDVKTLEIFYLNAVENDSDIVFFKTQCFNDEEKRITNWDYYKTPEIENMYKKKIINNKIIEKNLFKISTNVYDKFYKTSLLKNIKAKFYKNDNLTNNCFNYKVFLNTSKVSLVEKELYFHRIDKNLDLDYNKDSIGLNYTKTIEKANQMISIFKNNNAYHKHLKELLNYKIEKIRKSYYKISKKHKDEYFNLIKKDFIKINGDTTTNNEYIENLNKKNLEFYLKITDSELKDVKNNYIKKTDLSSSQQRRKKALIIEPNNFHGEVITTYAKYFIDLNYDLDIIMMKKNHEMEPLERYNSDRIHIHSISHEKLTEFLSSPHNLQTYDIILFTSHKDYNYTDEIDNMSVFKIFPVLNIPKIKNKTIAIEHNFIMTKHLEELLNNNHILTLSNLGYEDIVVTNVYYGDVEVTNKNIDKTVFIMVGNLESKRRNWDLLVQSVEELDQKGYSNFKVVVVGSGDFGDIPSKIRKYFELRGRVDYPDMYSEVERADFILPMLNPENPEHDRYLTTSQSGSFLLVYGFKKPAIVNEKFIEKYRISDDNSIIYEKNENLKEAMEKAILMNTEEYEKLQINLSKIVEDIDKKSFHNFQKIILSLNSKSKKI